MTAEVAQPKIALAGLTPAEIADALQLKPFQGKQIFRWIHVKQQFDFAEMSDLSKPLRQMLQEKCSATSVLLAEMQQSPRTGTKKALLELGDGETVESVLIRDEDRVTLCVSSQVGCPLKCDFCATGLAGFTR
ncbi:MAG: 23S rRNA (adenine(2503)-C(2))-methyltransferase RlmN, partial [Candidatus Hydrogenedentes bacterium]|nr:23S rRNA (adenine(2503)-C(2))-methyltransferase RlmN [Candidatus Hydrogenedentota bacterium]